MADNTSGFESGFGIKETMTIGAGNMQLAEDLLSPETSTVSAEDLASIENNQDSEEGKEKSDGKQNQASSKTNSDTLRKFLYEDDDEAEEDDEGEEGKPTTVNTTTQKPVKTDSKENIIEEQDADEDKTKNPKGGVRFDALAKDLLDLGVFTQEEGEELNITDPDAFLERFTLEKQKGANEMVSNFLGQFGEDYQNAFESIFVKGVDPKEYFQTTEVISNFSEMDLTKEDNQKRVLRQALRDQGFETEDIESEIERIEGRMKYLRQSADLSTITVNLSTDPSVLPTLDETDKWRPVGILKDAARTMLDALKGIVNIVIWLIVFLPVWFIIFLIVWVIIKLLKRQKN